MKLKLTVFVCSVLIFGSLVTGCAKPPTEEMNNAVEAVTRAENDIDAVTYAGNTVARARDALSRMQNEAASKRYDAAKSYAAEAIAAAERAISEGRSGAARARDEAAMLVSELPLLIIETRQGIDAARSARLPLNFTTLNNDFDKASNDADDAQIAFSDELYEDALRLGRTARSELAEINAQLTGAVTGSRRK